MHLARLEARTAVTRVLARLPHVRLEAPEPPRGLVFRKPAKLDAVWGLSEYRL
jgi:cytochrome P450